LEDIFDNNSDRAEKSFRYPFYERYLFVVAFVVLIAALVARSRLEGLLKGDPRRAIAAAAIIGLFGLFCFWISFRAWQSKVIISNTSLKGWYLLQGYERISWVNVSEVTYKWMPLGHKLVFVGSDGAKVSFRSSVTAYDELLRFIHENAPEHIVDELEEIFGEEQFEEEPEEEEEEEEGEEEEEEDEDEEDDDD
jgi:hypothetical protein